jgi:hypothetical protein
MIKDMIFGVVGGLGLFLFGMGLMSDGLKKVAGQKLRGILESLTKNRIIAVLVGALTTCLIQSSSATTVMTVGFVNAGLLTLKQALCVVLGANVGTTITAGLVSVLAVFKITNYALPVVGVGFLMTVLGKTRKNKSIGQVMIGFGVLFLGIHFMKEAFDPLQDHQGVQEALIWLGRKQLDLDCNDSDIGLSRRLRDRLAFSAAGCNTIYIRGQYRYNNNGANSGTSVIQKRQTNGNGAHNLQCDRRNLHAAAGVDRVVQLCSAMAYARPFGAEYDNERYILCPFHIQRI